MVQIAQQCHHQQVSMFLKLIKATKVSGRYVCCLHLCVSVTEILQTN